MVDAQLLERLKHVFPWRLAARADRSFTEAREIYRDSGESSLSEPVQVLAPHRAIGHACM